MDGSDRFCSMEYLCLNFVADRRRVQELIPEFKKSCQKRINQSERSEVYRLPHFSFSPSSSLPLASLYPSAFYQYILRGDGTTASANPLSFPLLIAILSSSSPTPSLVSIPLPLPFPPTTLPPIHSLSDVTRRRPCSSRSTRQTICKRGRTLAVHMQPPALRARART